MNRWEALADAIDALLPQTQCRKCGYAGCRPYAEALARGEAAPNRCPPGGNDIARDLAAITGVPFRPLDPPFGQTPVPAVALIEEEACIGCTLCLEACPVDAIVGAVKRMHTVIAAECTGCELCIPPCPADCIRMVKTPAVPTAEERRAAANRARRRFAAREFRLRRERDMRIARIAASKAESAQARKRAAVARAMARARERLRTAGR